MPITSARARRQMKAYWARMTPAEKLAEIQRRVAKRTKTQRTNGKTSKSSTSHPNPTGSNGHRHGTTQEDLLDLNGDLDFHVSYAFGRAQGWLHAYAESLGIAGPTLAFRVGHLLQDAARRPDVGAPVSVSGV